VRLPEPHRPPIYAWLLERRLLPSLYTSTPLAGAWLKPCPSLTHAALVATSSPPTPAPCHPGPSYVVGAGRAAGKWNCKTSQPRWAPWLWRRPSANSDQCRPALRAFWPRVVAIANPSLIETKIHYPGHVCFITLTPRVVRGARGALEAHLWCFESQNTAYFTPYQWLNPIL
jgi:hypothetical protein